MKKLFSAINNGNFEVVQEIIKKKPELVNCIAKAPPKRDEGQSPLKVAIKNGYYEIVDFLIEQDADVNFIPQTTCDGHLIPIISQAVYSALRKARNPTYTGCKDKNGMSEYLIFGDKEVFQNALSILKRVISAGADLTATDNYGNSCLEEAVREALRFGSRFCFPERTYLPVVVEWEEDIKEVFNLLITNGVSTEISDERLNLKWLITGKNNLLKFLME